MQRDLHLSCLLSKTSPGPQCKHEKTLRDVKLRGILQKYLTSPPQTVEVTLNNHGRLRSHHRPGEPKEALKAACGWRGVLNQTGGRGEAQTKPEPGPGGATASTPQSWPERRDRGPSTSGKTGRWAEGVGPGQLGCKFRGALTLGAPHG